MKQFPRYATLILLLLIITLTACTTAQTPAGETLSGPYAVDRITDGDTIRVFINGDSVRIRLLNVDSPEMNFSSNEPPEPFAQEATNLTASLLENQNVMLGFDIQQTDHYGRLLAGVYLQHPQGTHIINGTPYILINEQLALHGLADLMIIQPNVKYADLIRAAIRDAQTNQRGMWAP